MLVAGDISLAEMSRYPVPIMARPPLGVSDITLENWLQEVGRSQKGIKLTFTSTRTVEPAFRVLARHADHLRGPLILNADILARPSASQPPGGRPGGRQQQQQQQSARQPQPVDAWTFLMLCRTRFPKSTISIGWCSAPAQAAWEGSAPALGAESGASSMSAESMFELDMALEQQVGVQLLAAASRAPAGQLHPFPLVQQLAAGPQPAGRHGHGHHHHHHHHILASSGSLNSSSGNSSGSPSPTSPISHLMNPSHQPAELEPAASSKAAVGWSQAVAAAAMVAASSLQQQQQLPLNLNINEAEPQHAAGLSELAAKIQSLQQQQQQTGLARPEETAAAVALAGKLLAGSAANHWPHVSKKAALGSASPSPQSSSPRQQQQAQSGSLLCVKTSHLAPPAAATGGGYTREMIDKMASLVKEYNLTQPVTFPVEAVRLVRDQSICELQRLLYQVGANSSLTLVAQPEDLIGVEELLQIRKHFAANQILFDLPDELAASLRHELELL